MPIEGHKLRIVKDGERKRWERERWEEIERYIERRWRGGGRG